MPSLGSLETEILAGILRIKAWPKEFIESLLSISGHDHYFKVDDESPHTTKKSVVLVNRHFYTTAQLVAHRRKTLIYYLDKVGATQKQIQTWLEDPLMLRSIREINVVGPWPRHWTSRRRGTPDDDDDDLAARMTAMWAPLDELVKKAARLVKVNFDHGEAVFPHVLLDALQKFHPHVQLCIWNYYRSPQLDHTDAAEQALMCSPILRSIRASIWTSGAGPGIDLRLVAFQRIVANAPNLKFASVNRGHTGCVIRSQSPQNEALEREAATKFLSYSHGPNTSMRSLTLDGFELKESTLNEWGKVVSLPHLECLKCSRGIPDASYFKVASSLLTNLKHVSLNLSTFSKDPELVNLVDNHILSCAPLETLSLWSWMGVVSVDTILKHGPTLQMLQLHERESLSMDKGRGLLSLEDISRIRQECPQLKDLTLDMDRAAADWQKDIDLHKAVLEELARFGGRLHKLQIYLDLGIANEVAGLHRGRVRQESADAVRVEEGGDDSDTSAEYDYRGPFPPPENEADVSKHAEQIWKIVFGDPANHGSRELDIKWGEWERKMGTGYPAGWVVWEQENKKHLVVRPHERDDRPGEAVIKVHGAEGRQRWYGEPGIQRI